MTERIVPLRNLPIFNFKPKDSMKLFSQLMIAFVALEHLYILWMEMFAWETRGKKVFKNALPEEMFKPTKGLAANQGLYNGFLSAGLIWTFFITDTIWQTNIATFFLSCVIIAGLYGAYSADKKIFFVQALPALIALAITLMASCEV
jgi:putative membrane protein